MPQRRLEAERILEIMRLRVQGLSIDKILLALEYGVARGSVAKYTRLIDDLDDEIKARDLLFEWSRLDLCKCPWEASEWLTECQFVFEAAALASAFASDCSENGLEVDEIRARLSNREPFTNRLADWCWRVHLVDPNLDSNEVVMIAPVYASCEQLRDLIPDEPPIDMRWLDALLRYRPYSSRQDFSVYHQAAVLGVIPRMPSFKTISILTDLPTNPEIRYKGSMTVLDRFGLWLVERIDRWAETELQDRELQAKTDAELDTEA